MTFDPAEKERIRYHMGYLQVGPAASITFGIPAPIQTLFLVEAAMDRVIVAAEDRVRKLVAILDEIECKLVSALDYLAVSAVDGIQIRPDHIEKLEDSYASWAAKLADVLGAPLYPGAERFKRLFSVGGPGQAGSIPVRG